MELPPKVTTERRRDGGTVQMDTMDDQIRRSPDRPIASYKFRLHYIYSTQVRMTKLLSIVMLVDLHVGESRIQSTVQNDLIDLSAHDTTWLALGSNGEGALFPVALQGQAVGSTRNHARRLPAQCGSGAADGGRHRSRVEEIADRSERLQQRRLHDGSARRRFLL